MKTYTAQQFHHSPDIRVPGHAPSCDILIGPGAIWDLPAVMETFKSHRNLCGRIRRMLIASCKTLKENTK